MRHSGARLAKRSRRLGPPAPLATLKELIDVSLILDSPAFFPAAVMDGDLFSVAYDAHGVVVGSNTDGAAHMIGRDRV